MRQNQGSEAMAGAYGRNLGTKYGAEDAPAIVTRSLHSTEIAVTEICVHRPPGRLSDPIPRVDAYMICLMLRDIPNNSYLEEGRQFSSYSLRAGEVTIHNLRREPLAVIDKPIHSLLCYIPSAALNALADQANGPRITELRYKPALVLLSETIKPIGLRSEERRVGKECRS